MIQGPSLPSLHDKNIQTIAYMNRKNRRKAERLMSRGYDDEQISEELKRLSRDSRPSKLVAMWRKILKRLNRQDPYYTHIPKQVRPMVCTGYKEGTPIMVADHIKCEKLRRKGARK
jgi:hypothetical protein